MPTLGEGFRVVAALAACGAQRNPCLLYCAQCALPNSSCATAPRRAATPLPPPQVLQAHEKACKRQPPVEQSAATSLQLEAREAAALP
jgi:hypothetical protein